MLIEVMTDEGVKGIGAAHAGLEAPHFLGQDPSDRPERQVPSWTAGVAPSSFAPPG